MNALFNDTIHWTKIKDCNNAASQLHKRHYSCKKNKKDNKITAPGHSIILLSKNNDALLIWHKSKYRKDKNTGVQCSLFRNESTILSSTLILQAEQILQQLWGKQPMFTFVNPNKIKSTNPGYCFKKAGWKQTGKTKKNLIILTK